MYSLEQLKEIIIKLRDPQTGCPWDKVQTHQTLTPYVIEEAYEVVAAIEQNEPRLLQEELGDLLLQIVLHARLAEEQKQFALEDVIHQISEKLIRRHPHVFSDVKAATVDKVWQNWEKIKAAEKEQGLSIMDSVPRTLPALMRSEKVQKRASRVGFDWDKKEDVLQKIQEEFQEFCQAKTKDQQTEELGDLLFSIVNLARKYEIPAEEALRKATDKFISRFKKVENQVKASKKDFTSYTLSELDEFWAEAKK
jgi:tetrapyrrole methylase family protein / MazG family protein